MKKNIKLFVALLISVLAVSGCVSDYSVPDPLMVSAELKIQLFSEDDPALSRATEVGSLPENQIDNLTVMLFNHATGALEFSSRITDFSGNSQSGVNMNQWVSGKVIGIIKDIVLAKATVPMDIHLVANVGTSTLSGVTTLAQLKALTLTPIVANQTTPITTPIVMHGSVDSHVFASTQRATIKLERAVAKIRVNLTATGYTSGADTYEFCPTGSTATLQPKTTTNLGWIVGGRFNSPAVQYIDYAQNSLTAGTVSGLTKNFKGEVLVNENLASAYTSANTTYVILQVPYKKNGVLSTENFYKVEFKNEIQRNTIYDLQINITSLGGSVASTPQVEGVLSIIPWTASSSTADINQRFISVDRSVIPIVTPQTVNYNTNGVSFTATSQASWLTAVLNTTAKTIALTSDNSTYTAPRSTTVTLKADYLTKMVTVNQEATVSTGSIAVSPTKLYVHSVAEGGAAKLFNVTVSPTNSPWKRLDADNLRASFASISASAIVIGNLANIPVTGLAASGNTSFRVMNVNTLEYATLEVCNLLLDAPTSISVGGQGTGTGEGQPASFVYTSLTALGGDENWNIVSQTNWSTMSLDGTWNFTATKNASNQLEIKTQPCPTMSDRTATLVVSHINDPTYTKTIQVIQKGHIVITMPEFDYFVFEYMWDTREASGIAQRSDMDTMTEFNANNWTGIDGLSMGWSGTAPDQTTDEPYTKYILTPGSATSKLAWWAGDNQNGGGETVTFNLTDLCGIPEGVAPRFVNIFAYATWYVKQAVSYDTNGVMYSARGTFPVYFNIRGYKGGDMDKNGFIFQNIGGTLTYEMKIPIFIKTYQGASTFRDGGYQKIVKVIYDREQKGGVLEFPNVTTNTWPTVTGRSAAPMVSPVVPLNAMIKTKK